MRSQRWREELAKKASYKALDIPDDDMHINVNKGIGAKELAIMGLMGFGAGGLSFGLGQWMNGGSQTPPAVLAPAQPGASPFRDTDTDTYNEYELKIIKDR
jgi:hypothetical protein